MPLVDCVKGNVEQRRNFISREGTFRLSTSRFAGLRHVDRSDCDRRTVRIGAGPQHWRHGPTIRITDPCVRQRSPTRTIGVLEKPDRQGAVTMMTADTPTIVFVHGAWADASGFGGVDSRPARPRVRRHRCRPTRSAT